MSMAVLVTIQQGPIRPPDRPDLGLILPGRRQGGLGRQDHTGCFAGLMRRCRPLGSLPSKPPVRLSTEMNMKILGLPGSIREGSFNRRLLHAASLAAPPETAIDIYSGLGVLPLFSEDLETGPPHPAVKDLHDAITAADAVLIATPEYNGSIPGPLKNALDWASRPHGAAPLANKPVAVVGASPSRFGAVRAQADVRRVTSSIGSLVVERGLPLARAFDAFTADHRLSDPYDRQRLEAIIHELIQLVSTAERAKLVS